MSRKKILAHGTFDVLHSGHFNLFYDADKIGDLYVAVRPTESVKIKKNLTTLQETDERMKNVQLISFVKDVDIADYNVADTLRLIKKWSIDAIIAGEDHRDNELYKEISKISGVEIIILNRTNDISSTEIRRKLKKA